MQAGSDRHLSGVVLARVAHRETLITGMCTSNKMVGSA
jgi:hypothetical protein